MFIYLALCIGSTLKLVSAVILPPKWTKNKAYYSSILQPGIDIVEIRW